MNEKVKLILKIIVNETTYAKIEIKRSTIIDKTKKYKQLKERKRQLR